MDPQTARIEHLKLIQAVIARLARNSFAIKSLAVAASAALIAFTASTETPLASVGGAAFCLYGDWTPATSGRSASFATFTITSEQNQRQSSGHAITSAWTYQSADNPKRVYYWWWSALAFRWSTYRFWY